MRMRTSTGNTSFTAHQSQLLALIGRAIALIPHRVKSLLEHHRYGLTRLPSSAELTDVLIRALSSGNQVFIEDFSELLVQFDLYDQQQSSEDRFDPSMIAAAVGTVSTGIGSIFTSRNDRKAVEADAKAQVELANTEARSGFMQNLVKLKAQAEQGRLASVMSQQKTKIVTTVATATVVALALIFGFRYMKANPTHVNP